MTSRTGMFSEDVSFFGNDKLLRGQFEELKIPSGLKLSKRGTLPQILQARHKMQRCYSFLLPAAGPKRNNKGHSANGSLREVKLLCRYV